MPDSTEPASSQAPTESTTPGPGRAVYGPKTERADGRLRSGRRVGDDGRLRRPGRFGSGADRPAGGRDGEGVRELLLDVVRESVGASSRELLCGAICERFVEGELYRFARIDEPTTGTDRLTTRASAGDPPTAGGASDGPHELGALSERAFRTGDAQLGCVRDRRRDGFVRGSRREAFATTGGRAGETAVAVPLGHDEMVFGVLVVVTADGGLVPHERRELCVVGETIGYAFSALRARELLYAQRVTEVEFEFAGDASFLCRTAAELGCSLRLDSYVETSDGETSDGEWLLYVSVSGGDAASFPAVVADADGVRTVNHIGSHDDGVSVGVRARTPLLDSVAAVGGVVTAAAMTPRGGRVTVELPGSVDVRLLVGQIRSLYPDATMRSRTTHDRPVRDGALRSDDGGPDLTDRQREVLEACYRAGYFEWPRESTAEEVADLLGIAAPTLHAHLRKAEKALLTAFFGPADGDAGRPDGAGSSGDSDDAGAAAGRRTLGGRDCISGP